MGQVTHHASENGLDALAWLSKKITNKSVFAHGDTKVSELPYAGHGCYQAEVTVHVQPLVCDNESEMSSSPPLPSQRNTCYQNN